MTNYRYSAFGLNFASTFPLPELITNNENEPDVKISYGKVPKKLESPSAHGLLWQSEPGKLLLSIDDIARYLVLENREIIIESAPQSKEEDIRAFLFGSVMGALLYARQIPIIHSSVIETKKGAVIFMGKSGAGKSTLLAAFLKRGYGMLSDDKAGIIIDENRIARVLPAFPFTRMTKETAEHLDFPTKGSWINSGIGKYVIPVKNFIENPTKIHAAYSIKEHNKDEIVLESQDAFYKFQHLNRNTYRRRFINQPERKKHHLKIISKLAEQARVIKVLRPNNAQMINETTDRIEEDFNN